MTDELWKMSAVEQAGLVRSKKVAARELLADHLARIDKVNPTVNAVVAMDPSVAEARAAAIDETIANGGKAGPLGGLVTAHKDLTETADFVTTFGSPVYAGNRPAADSLLVARMKAAGAVAVGKTNSPEVGAGSHTFNPVYGMTVNPYDTGRSCGGSSGGAAVAVRTGMVSVADGSDLGGSLRNPAAWNNIVGFRASPRVIPRPNATNPWNPMPMEGPMARSVDDLILLLRVLAQPYEADPLSRPISLSPVVSPPTRPLRVAWSSNLGGVPVEPDIAEALDRFRADIDLLGWEVTEAEPDFTGADEAFVTLRAFIFLERAETLGENVSKLKATVQDEIARGLALTSSQVAKAYAHLGVLWRRAISFFEDHDLLIGPVTQVSPFPIDWEYPTEINGIPMSTYVEWMRSCCRITALGCPALSLPAGFTPAGLPVGAQLIGRPYGDGALLEAAKALEATTGHGLRRPDM
ncbi:MAG: amidase family protein [Acidimicrobiales bacterium]